MIKLKKYKILRNLSIIIYEGINNEGLQNENITHFRIILNTCRD